MPGLDSIAVGLVSNLFKGSSAVAAKTDHHRFIDSLGARRDIASLQKVAYGGPVGPVPPWNVLVDYNSGNTAAGGSKAAEFAEYRAYASQWLVQLTGSVQPTPTVAQLPNASQTSGAMPTTSSQSALEAILQRALSAGEAELATRVAAGATVAAGQANRTEQQASMVPNITPKQVVIVVVVVIVLAMLLRRR